MARSCSQGMTTYVPKGLIYITLNTLTSMESNASWFSRMASQLGPPLAGSWAWNHILVSTRSMRLTRLLLKSVSSPMGTQKVLSLLLVILVLLYLSEVAGSWGCLLEVLVPPIE